MSKVTDLSKIGVSDLLLYSSCSWYRCKKYISLRGRHVCLCALYIQMQYNPQVHQFITKIKEFSWTLWPSCELGLLHFEIDKTWIISWSTFFSNWGIYRIYDPAANNITVVKALRRKHMWTFGVYFLSSCW